MLCSSGMHSYCFKKFYCRFYSVEQGLPSSMLYSSATCTTAAASATTTACPAACSAALGCTVTALRYSTVESTAAVDCSTALRPSRMQVRLCSAGSVQCNNCICAVLSGVQCKYKTQGNSGASWIFSCSHLSYWWPCVLAQRYWRSMQVFFSWHPSKDWVWISYFFLLT